LVGAWLLIALALPVTIAQADEPLTKTGSVSRPSQPQPSAAAQKALAYVATREGIPNEALIIGADHPTQLPHLGRKFQVVTLLDTRPQTQVYKLLVDLENEQVLSEAEVSDLREAEREAYRAKYGRLEPALYERLQELNDKDTVPVLVWMASRFQGKTLADHRQTAFAALAEKYPAAETAMENFGRPFAVDDRELGRRIRAEYFEMLNTETTLRTQPLMTKLNQQGFAVTSHRGMPALSGVLPKYVIILELNNRSDIGAIYLLEDKFQPALNVSVPSTLAPTVWGKGYTGSGVKIAILESGNVDTNNSFLNHFLLFRPGGDGVEDHVTRVASVAASFHYPYRGMAYGATVLSAGHDNNIQLDAVEAYKWAVEIQGVDVVNFSETIYNGNQMSGYDMAFDYWVYQKSKLLVAGAGNLHSTANPDNIVGSPAKGWNVLAVGAYNDMGTIEWAGDGIPGFSSYKNPASPWHDREKPEVVAPGVNIMTLGLGNNPASESGTSYAAPHVAGLAALLIDRDQQLRDLPEVTKAIIMASATHNIEGYSIIMPPWAGDQRDGAGGINAELAYETARTKGSSIAPCLVSCWWHEYINNANLPVGGDLTHTFYAEQGELIRVAISWWSNVSKSGNDYNSQLDTDLDLVIKDPNGSQVTSSLSADNNYELVQFFAPKTGYHTIVVHKTGAYENTNYVGIALVKNIPTQKVYLPIILKNSS
jgi:subtilisin family serine protease